MAGFETVVRPAVSPDIRPAAAQAKGPKGSTDASIGGSGGQVIDLQNTYAVSWSRQIGKESERTVSQVRQYEVRTDGSVNKSKYWDYEVLTKLVSQDSNKVKSTMEYAPVEGAPNLEIMQTGVVKKN